MLFYFYVLRSWGCNVRVVGERAKTAIVASIVYAYGCITSAPTSNNIIAVIALSDLL
jgi:hypothetical protein